MEFINVTASICNENGEIDRFEKRVKLVINPDIIICIMNQSVFFKQDKILKLGNNFYTDFRMESFRFRWRYHTSKGNWTNWETTSIHSPGDIDHYVELRSGTHAGALLFKALIKPDGHFTAYIEWHNSLHQLKSVDDLVNGLTTSNVDLRVEWPNEIYKPETYYLAVERII